MQSKIIATPFYLKMHPILISLLYIFRNNIIDMKVYFKTLDVDSVEQQVSYGFPEFAGKYKGWSV